jgi:hypothetical protein
MMTTATKNQNDTKIATIHLDYPTAAVAVGKLDQSAQDAILTTGGDLVLKTGKSPNGMDCTVIARFATCGKCQGYFALAADGREQVVPSKQVELVMSRVN